MYSPPLSVVASRDSWGLSNESTNFCGTNTELEERHLGLQPIKASTVNLAEEGQKGQTDLRVGCGDLPHTLLGPD